MAAPSALCRQAGSLELCPGSRLMPILLALWVNVCLPWGWRGGC